MPFVEFNFPPQYTRVGCLVERIREEIFNRNVQKNNIIICELIDSLQI
jgi:hypothetical protein